MSRRSRVSLEQREMMLEFMMGHPDLARGRVNGSDAVRQRTNLLEELSTTLNGFGSGATKSPNKWWKCWQDWRSDVKGKALRLKKYSGGTGGGPAPAPLTKLEETLLQFCGIEMVEGIAGVADPLELPSTSITREESGEVLVEGPEIINFDAEVQVEIERETHQSRPKGKDDSLHSSLEKQAAAIQQLAAAVESMALSLERGLEAIAAGLQAVSVSINNQQHIVLRNSSEYLLQMENDQ